MLKSTAFYDVKPYNLVDIYRRFGGTYALHSQDRKASQADNPIDGGSTFLRKLIPDYTMSHTRR
jgi:hypothetical protein